MQGAQSGWARLAWDLGPAGLLFLVGVLTMDSRDPREPFAYLLLVAPLVARRAFPFAALVVISVLTVALSRDLSAPWVPVAAVALASYATGESNRDRVRSALGVVAVAGLMAFGFL